MGVRDVADSLWLRTLEDGSCPTLQVVRGAHTFAALLERSMSAPRIGQVRAADLLPDVLRRAVLAATIAPPLVLHGGEVRCLKCQRTTTRRLDRDVGIHEECER